MNGDGPLNGASQNARPARSWWAHAVRLGRPGMGLKRWLLVGAMGISVSSIGFAFLLRKLFELRFPDFLPSYFEGVLLVDRMSPADKLGNKAALEELVQRYKSARKPARRP